MPHRPRNQRLSPIVYSTAGQSCFFTVRATKDRAPFWTDRYAHIAVACLLEQGAKSNCHLDVYCVMPDHVHLIVTPDRDGVSSLDYVDRFKGRCSRELHLAGWKGEVWQRRSYDHVIRAVEDAQLVGAYILANPVRKGLVAEPAAYRWRGMAGKPLREA